MGRDRRTVAQLVTTSWGWSLVALFLCLSLAMGVYWNHPFYERKTSEDMTAWQEFLPLILGGVLWTLLVSVIVLCAAAHGRKHGLSVGDLRHVRLANWACLALSAVFASMLPGAIGAGIATFINSCLLVLCLVYVAIATALRVPIRSDTVVCTCGVVLSIVLCWV